MYEYQDDFYTQQYQCFENALTQVDSVYSTQAHVKIVEEPASRCFRFRYQCEGQTAGSLTGINSTREEKTYPTIRIEGYQGPALVIVSCVTADPPYKAHPNNLVGKGTKNGVLTAKMLPLTTEMKFKKLGIHCVRKRDIEESLNLREYIRVDPFKQGFDHKNHPNLIDLGALRLCFQVLVEGSVPGKCTVPLQPVVSAPIYDKKSKSKLSIVKLSHCVDYVDGGKKDIIILCDRVRFFEEKNSEVVWESRVALHPKQVFKQCALWFRSPPYERTDITEPVRVFIQLVRLSDGATSLPRPFELLPVNPALERKRRNMENDAILKVIQSKKPTLQVAGNYLETNNKSDREKETDETWNISLHKEIRRATQIVTDGLEIDSDVLNVLENNIASENPDYLPDIGNLSMSA